MGNCIRYKPSGLYAGAEDMLEREWQYLEQRRPGFDRKRIRGLAFSGGGIRSASFCLGVAQALADGDRLRHFDYLSTVSGGGYIGGALSWLWSERWREDATQRDAGEEALPLGVGPEDFPFGTRGRRFPRDEAARERSRLQSSLLRHLRQHGKYLTPGHGITGWSLFSIVLRSLVMGFLSLMLLAMTAFAAFYFFGLFDPQEATSVFFRSLGAWLLVGFVALQLLYMLAIAWLKRSKQHQVGRRRRSGALWGYRLRRWFETWIPRPLILALIAYGMALIHWLQLSVLQGMALEAGSISALLGAVLGVMGTQSSKTAWLKIIPPRIKALLGAGLMLLGLLVLADFAVDRMIAAWPDCYFPALLLAAAGWGLLAWWLPINNISIHRYYRDRLMEAFMPDIGRLLDGRSVHEARQANQTGVHELAEGGNPEVPYHLINTNLILVESKIAKFRGRGGDNFIISPLYSGSNATGWLETRDFCKGGITLPTAVAISGAAANPDAGVAGKGLTIHPLISVLMSVFNLRLGYWVNNPDKDSERAQQRLANYLKPGLWEILRRKSLNETADYLQLSDGGHFENLALYELFRRHARLIVVCDAGADPDYRFDDLANALEKARVDFGIDVELKREDLMRLSPAGKPASGERDYAVAERAWVSTPIRYHDGHEDGTLIYIKTTLCEGLSAELHGYKRAHPQFPDETTADQFFDEVQFEAYRQLGWEIGQKLLSDPELARLFA